ncbi:MAG: transporter ATP-binding protein [Paucimonas sp.]|jgi:iron complex transport system ATP-binding protein|nr:transporter ATP-binding protein [Paucimonas sp.]
MQAVNLTLEAGSGTLVRALDWHVRSGECWCLIGRNGAGKSTLLRTAAGLRQADSGEVQWQGKNIRDWQPLDLAGIRAYLPQVQHDAFGYRVIDTVLAARHPFSESAYWDGDADVEASHKALNACDAMHLAERDVRTLSGGERRRVALAAVFAQDAPYLLLDEPTLALDLAHQAAMMKLLSDLRGTGKSIVMATHDLNFAHGFATHALLLNGDGHWHAGAAAEMLQPKLLSHCLGYPVEAVTHDGRKLFFPACIKS